MAPAWHRRQGRTVRARTQDVCVRKPDLVHYVINRTTPENRPEKIKSGREIMTSLELDEVPRSRMAREIARERRERALHDELRAGLGALDDLRGKDARERADTCNLRRGGN
jgi:hypothetical protein